ncbi:bifunctional DNA primase/polymerase [uncultured Gordonia sp.]|uniref:bifunctional DNA primase/polymerase n=1 Tax=uncultured Gordonia sp. TaxID=198437 RepID=UPI00258674CC|nr:bifunctional DNA primase/polymerase [uncultured Gordonia sp.]
MPDHTDDDVNPLLADGYAAAAPQYWAAGWRGILPMPRGRKFPPPTNYTGYQALEPSYPDIQAWCDDNPDGNIALHLPHTIIGIDVDAYDGRTGAGTIAYAEHLWGALPNTVRTTSRDDTASGIRLYRVPPGTQLATKIEFPDHSLGHIEIIQASHRYAVVWPSLHPTGARYRWQNSNGEAVDIPSPDDLPHLPQQWIDNLAPGSTINGLDTVDITQEIARLTGGTMDLAVTDRLARAIGDLQGNSSRHDATCKHVLALLRLSEQGHDGIQAAISHLGNAFVAAVINDGSRTEQQARSEYARMVYNERGHALIKATPTVTNVVEVAELIRNADTARQQPIEPAATVTPDETVAIDQQEHDDPAAGNITLTDAEFWDSRDSLKAIRSQAYARLASPWSVLGVAICRALAHIPPWITLPPIIGGKGSLNTFAAIVGRSGAGKGISEAVAAELLPFDEGDNIGLLPVGSGEGLAHAYVVRRGKDSADGPGIERLRTSCMFSIPEVDTLTSIGGRQGSTIMSKLRSAYSGEEIGFSYADPTKRLLVGAHNYRMTMVLGVQPERAAPLFADAAGGTPQRFVWLPANDRRIGEDPGAEVGQLEVPAPREWGGNPRDVDIPDMARNVIRSAHIARARGDGNALDGHALQTREKVMVALCALDGRMTPDEWDWVLAGAVMAKSDETRNVIAAEMTAAVEREWAEKGRLAGVSREVADDTAHIRKLERIADRLAAALERRGPRMAWSDLAKAVHSRDRDAVPEAATLLVQRGRITLDPDTSHVTLLGGAE